jgi:hypothetical protein
VIEVKTRELTWALQATMPHASRDETVAALNAVRVEYEPGEGSLYLIASDRYTIAAARLNPEAGGRAERAAATIPLRDVRMLLARLTGAAAEEELAVRITTDALIIGGFYKFATLESGQLPGMPGTWLNWRHMIRGFMDTAGEQLADDDAVDPALLARFKTAGVAAVYRTVRSKTPRKPGTVLVISHNFAGACMAHTVAGDHPAAGAWDDWLHVTAGYAEANQ